MAATTKDAAAAAVGDVTLPTAGENLSLQVTQEDEDWRKLIPEKRFHTADVTDTRKGSFEEYSLKKELLRGIYAKRWEHPSPVQEDSIPMAISGYDILARAKNGVGKTGSYLIPILEKVDTTQNYTQALVLVPTIELASQTFTVCKELGKYIKGLSVLLIRGGTPLRDDIVNLQTQPNHIIIATPGRMADVTQHGNAKLDRLQTVVLDEADKLLSVDFFPVIEEIFRPMPATRQTLLFSATYPSLVKGFCDKYLRNYKVVNVMNELCLRGVTQYYAHVEERKKLFCLNTLFRHLTIFQSMIFCNSVPRVQMLSQKIVELGYSCAYIHARMESAMRTKVLHDFRGKVFRNLVASDLCARGIDVPDVNVVFNFDFPNTSDAYLHRVGRGGRFGGLALAVNLVTEQDRESKARIERELGFKMLPLPKEVDLALYTK